jgi:hypothetical protein
LSDKQSPDPNTIVVTACYGERFWAVVPKWTQHVAALTGLPIEIVSLDGRTYQNEALRIRTKSLSHHYKKAGYGWGDLPRLQHILSLLENDITCIQIDLDVILKRSIDTLIQLPYDLIISRAFSFPAEVAERFGFVMCTGFFIAKPGTVGLLRDLGQEIIDRRIKTNLDQGFLNLMLVDSVSWQTQIMNLAGQPSGLSVCKYAGCTIAVLPAEAIARNSDLEASTFGNHHSELLKHFEDRRDTSDSG